MKRLERLVSMALVLSARRRLKAADLDAHFSVSERTVYRDMRGLQEAGFPVEGNAGDGYRIPAGSYLRPLGLTEAETVALALGATLLEATADESLRDALSTALSKLESGLSPDVRGRLRRLRRSEMHLSPSARHPGGPLGRVLAALDARDVLLLEYDPVSGGERTKREIEPLGLVRVENAWLLLAWCRLRKDVRAFRVDRIRTLTGTGEQYTPRTGFSFEEVIARERRRRGGS